MNPALKDKLLRPVWLRRLIRFVFATGDTVRRAVQKPIVDAFLPDTGRRVIDVGAGRGMYSLDSLAPRFRQVVSVDIRTDHLAYLAEQKRRFGLDNLWLVRASAEALPFRDGVFDAVICTEVIEHLQDDRQGVAELSRLLRPAGHLVLSVPVPPAPRYDGAHVHEGYTCEQIETLLQANRLTVLNKDYCLLFISRSVLHIVAFFEGRLGIPPPVLMLCYLERWLIRCGKVRLKPYDIVVNAKKEEIRHAERAVNAVTHA